MRVSFIPTIFASVLGAQSNRRLMERGVFVAPCKAASVLATGFP